MARQSGRKGLLLIQLTTASTAESTISHMVDWSINFTVEQLDATAMGDSNKTYVAGLADCTGQVSGYLDASTTTDTYQAAVDGVARTFKLYPNRDDTGTYYSGSAIWDFSEQASVSGLDQFSASFAATTTVSRTHS